MTTQLGQARWIWDDGETSPRNAWRCFRRRFRTSGAAALLRITADTRYVAYVNGTRVGHGPVRSFADERHVDSWDIGPLLRAGENDVAVLVHHVGAWTFQNERGRGGLLAQIELSEGPIPTDESWEVRAHGGYESRAPRICPQMGFVEIVDGDWEPDWATSAGGWPAATVVGHPDDADRPQLSPRPVPALAETVVMPVAVRTAARVDASPISWTIDCRALFDPTSSTHANPSSYVGYLLTCLRISAAGPVRVGLPLTINHKRVRGLAVDGRWWGVDDLERGHADHRWLDLDLEPGDHWLAIDVTMYDHGYPLPFLLDGEHVELVTVLEQDAATPFVALGPVGEPDPALTRPLAHPAYERMAPRSDTADAVVAATAQRSLEPLAGQAPLHAVGLDDAIDVSLYGSIVHPRTRRPEPVAPWQAVAQGAPVAVDLTPGDDLELVLDLDTECSGFVMLDLDAPAGTVVDVYGFEYLDGDVREETEAMENAMRYRSRAGRQRFESAVRRGLRYLHVVLRGEGSVVLHQVALRSSHHPSPRTGQFAASDGLLTEIWEMSRRTVIACMEDTFVDCPGYEQAFWVGDTYSSARFASALFDADAIIEHCLRLVTKSAKQTPLLASQVPSGWTNVIPAWTFLWVRACAEHAERTGGIGFRDDIAPAAATAMEAFAEHLDERGLLSIEAWNLLDWAPMDQPNAGVVTHQNALFVLALRASAAMLAPSDPERAAALEQRADALAAAVAEHLWEPERGAYIDAIHTDGRRSEVVSVQTNLFALLAGIGSDAQLAGARALVVDPPPDIVQIGSPFMSIFRYDALLAAGQTGVALADLRRDYGAMLRAGARTCWEMFPAPHRTRMTRSHAHAWSAAPAAFLPTAVLGIRLDHAGRRVTVAPHIGDLEWARGAVPMAGGLVEVRWQRDGDRLELSVRAPQGVEVDVGEPDGLTVSTTIGLSA